MDLSPIKAKHVIDAANWIDKNGVPANRRSKSFYVLINNKQYHFKYTVSVAYSLATGNDLGPDDFWSNESSRDYVEKLGFEIINKNTAPDSLLSLPNWELFDSYDDKVILDKFNKYMVEIVFKNKDIIHIPYLNAWILAHKTGLYVKPGKKPRNPEELNKYLPQIKNRKIDKQMKVFFENIMNKPENTYNNIEIMKTGNKANRMLEFKRKTVEQKLARICWNTNGWIKPSGRAGKSTSKSHEKNYGFGFEEWIFDFDKTIDGIHYAFLEPIHQHWEKYINQTFNISLFTVNGKDKLKYWIGDIQNVKVISQQESEEVVKIYKDNGWLKEMKNDLINMNIDADQFENWEENSELFNIKFNYKNDAIIHNEPIPIDPNDKRVSAYYYVLYNLDTPFEIPAEIEFDFNTGNSGGRSLKTKAKKSFKQNHIEQELTHNQISDAFLKYMQIKFGKSKVKRECIAYGQNRVDIVRQEGNEYIFYEIKTFEHLITSMRVALGQLFEYNFYPDKINAKKLVLVSHKPADSNFEKYINHLNTIIRIPIGYIQFDHKKNEILQEIP